MITTKTIRKPHPKIKRTPVEKNYADNAPGVNDKSLRAFWLRCKLDDDLPDYDGSIVCGHSRREVFRNIRMEVLAAHIKLSKSSQQKVVMDCPHCRQMTKIHLDDFRFECLGSRCGASWQLWSTKDVEQFADALFPQNTPEWKSFTIEIGHLINCGEMSEWRYPKWLRRELEASAISGEDALEHGITFLIASDFQTAIGWKPQGRDGTDCTAYAIPFRDPASGKDMMGKDGSPFIRYKLHPAAKTKDGTAKYISRTGSGQRAFIPPAAHDHFFSDPEATVVLTEGEKKAISATLHGLPTIGLTGINGWNRSAGSIELLEELLSYKDNKKWLLVYDSDGASNPAFADNARKLAISLFRYGISLDVVYLPKLVAGKTGLDDFFCRCPNGIGKLHEYIRGHATRVEIAPEPWALIEDGAVPIARPFPWSELPTVLSRIGREIAETVKVPDEYPGLGALVFASIAVANKLLVRVKSGHVQFANLYGMAVMPPTSGKTPAIRPLREPFDEIQERLNSEYRCLLAGHQGRKEQQDMQVSVAKSELMKLKRKGIREGEAIDESDLCEALDKARGSGGDSPTERILMADDASSEKLAVLMQNNGGAVASVSTDGRKIIHIAGGLYSGNGAADLDVWLKGFSGDPIRVDRVTRDSVTLARPCLSAFVAVQRDILDNLGASREFRMSGFLHRWLIIVPEPLKGSYPRKSVSDASKEKYGEYIKWLFNLPLLEDDEGKKKAKAVSLTPEAFSAWDAFYDLRHLHGSTDQSDEQLERHGKLTDIALRIALLLHTGDCFEDGLEPFEITGEQMRRAIRLADYFDEHSRRAFDIMGVDLIDAQSRQVWKWCVKHVADLQSKREEDGLGPMQAVKPKELARAGVAGVSDVERHLRLLTRLHDKGYVQRVSVGLKKGSKPHVVFALNPLNIQRDGKQKSGKSGKSVGGGYARIIERKLRLAGLLAGKEEDVQ